MEDLAELVGLVGRGGAVILSGAGLSTESGIPDYRGATGSQRHHTPMTYQTFMGDPVARHRYWARSYLGWRRISGARPNAGHHAVAALQKSGLVTGVITQNVDGLHQAAGAEGVVELHGGLDRVICQSCRQVTGRSRLDEALRQANPAFLEMVEQINREQGDDERRDGDRSNPDGDAELAEEALSSFVMVGCDACDDGLLKPDVVFFGETVPRPRVDRCFEMVDSATSLIVLGSSLKVMSGFRFVLRATKLTIPVAIVNQGPTRGDTYCDVRVDAPLGVALGALTDEVLSAETRSPRVPVYSPDQTWP